MAVVIVRVQGQINDLALDTLFGGFIGFTLGVNSRCTGFIVANSPFCSLFKSLDGVDILTQLR